ncbi:MAG: hypothetical protein AB8C13_01790 [Phycisphaerales bacterium]
MKEESPQLEPVSTRAVLLKHTLADLTWHYDWLIERPGLEIEHRLLSFQTNSNPALWISRDAHIVRKLPDHRAHYLTYEGVILGGRGHVKRMESGIAICSHNITDGVLQLDIRWDGPHDDAQTALKSQYQGELVGDDQWKIWKV